MLSKSSFRTIIVLLVLGAALVTFAFVNFESGKRSASVPAPVINSGWIFHGRGGGGSASGASNQIMPPFTAADALRQYELRYAGKDFSYSQVEQLRAERQVNVPIADRSYDSIENLRDQSLIKATRLEELAQIKDDVIPADARLSEATRLEELAQIKDGDAH